MIWTYLVVLLVSFVALAYFADRFVLAAVHVARRTRLPAMWVGLVLVGFITSLPEALVSLAAIVNHHANVAIGNALGSYLANIGLVLGMTALVKPILIHPTFLRRELPVLTFVYAIVWLCFANQTLDQIDAWVLLVSLILVIAYLSYWVMKDANHEMHVIERSFRSVRWIVMWLSIGGLGLWCSAQGLIWSSTGIAAMLGMSDMVIGGTIVAIGTSLPELAASLASVRHGQDDIAVGNVIGSNIFGLLGVLLLPAFLVPGPLPWHLVARDLYAMGGMTVLLWLSVLPVKKRQAVLDRPKGLILVVYFMLYLLWVWQDF
jgi:cation:H+ antiporter